MYKKIMICPYFGPLPEWWDRYEKPEGYDLLLDQDLESFKKRVKSKLGIECPIIPGSTKVSDYRCALGVLYEDEIKSYDFFGHCDFDMIYGDVNKWFTDEILSGLDIWSNHDTYISGPWTLYRNSKRVRELFMHYPDWKEKITDPETNGWVEQEYSRLVERSGLRYKYTSWQGNPWASTFNIEKEGGKLYQDGIEIPLFHFRRTKQWPITHTK